MRIRSEQMGQMQMVRDMDFCNQLCAELRADTPDQTSHFSDEHLFNVVSEAYKKAKRYDIASGEGTRCFIKLAVLVDSRFDEVSDVRRFLNMPDLDPDLKIKLLSELTAQQLRAKVF